MTNFSIMKGFADIKMKKTAFSYLELIIAMTLVVVVVILSAPLMTSMGKKASPMYGEFKCYARLVDGQWTLFQNERVNSDTYPSEDTELDADQPCVFSKPVGNISSYTVTVYGGGGSGSMPYFEKVENDKIYFSAGVDGESGEEKSVADSLVKAFDTDGKLRIYMCDDSVSQKNCVGKGGDVNTSMTSTADDVYISKIRDYIKKNSAISLVYLNYVLENCTGPSGCTNDTIERYAKCLSKSTCDSESCCANNYTLCMNSCSSSCSSCQIGCINSSNACFRNCTQRYSKNSKELTSCKEKCSSTYTSCRNKCDTNLNDCRSSCNNTQENCKYKVKYCKNNVSYYRDRLLSCVNTNKCTPSGTGGGSENTGNIGANSKIITSNNEYLTAFGGGYGSTNSLKLIGYNLSDLNNEGDMYYYPEEVSPDISSGSFNNCSGEDANNPSDTDVYENYGVNGKAGGFVCKIPYYSDLNILDKDKVKYGSNATVTNLSCYLGFGGAGAGGAIVIQWN